jgi:hypothetical protein
MADTCSKVIVGNEGYSKAALRQMLGNMMDIWQTTGEVDIPALGNFLNQLVDTMPDADPVSVIGPGEVGPADLGGEELGDDSNVRLEYDACPSWVDTVRCGNVLCPPALIRPRRLHFHVTSGVHQYYTNLPLMEYDSAVGMPCKPDAYGFYSEDCVELENVHCDLGVGSFTDWGITHVKGTAWTSAELDEVQTAISNIGHRMDNYNAMFRQLIQDLSEYYDLVDYYVYWTDFA